MASDTYFIRDRGRILGPFDLEGLRKMVQIGTLTRIQEVSTDRVTWVTAGSMESVFVPPPARSRTPVTQPADAVAKPTEAVQPPLDFAEAPSPSARASTASDGLFFYSHQGESYGPIPLAALRALAANGMLRPDDPVWKAGDTSPASAAQASAAGAFFAGETSLPQPRATPVATGRTPSLVRQANRLALASGFSLAILLLFCLSVPHGKTAERLTWWWELLGQSGATLAVGFCFYTLLVALGLVLVTALVRGAARGGFFAGAGAVGLAILTVMSISPAVPALRLAAALLAPAGGIALIFVALSRSLAPQAGAGRAVQGIFGAAVCLASVVGGALAAWGFLGLWSEGGAPTWMLLSVLLAVAGLLCGVACGSIAIAGAMFSRPMLIPAVVMGVAVAVIGVVLAMVSGYGLSDMLASQTPGSRFVFVQALKLLAATYALAGLLGVGLLELLTTGGPGRTGAVSA
jgi:hypothetical protein